MKICLINYGIFERRGGMGNVTYNIALEFGKLGNEVHIIALSIDFEKKINTIAQHVYLHELPNHTKYTRCKLLTHHQFIVPHTITSYQIYQKLKEIEPDIVIDQTHESILPCYLYYCIYHVPYCVAIHGIPLLSRIGKISKNHGMGRLLPHLPQYLAARKYITVANHLVPQLREYYPHEAIVIPNGIDSDKFFPARDESSNKRKNQQLILIASRLDYEKGVSDAISAMSEITKSYPKAQLIILGDGPYQSELEKQMVSLHLEDNVTFAGFIPYDTIVSYYQRATLYLHPSWSEACPLVTLEAMGCGLPIVATAVGNAPDVIKKENGIVVPPHSPSKLATAVCDILSLSDEEYNKMSEANITAVQDQGWDKVAMKYIEVFQSILSHKSDS